MNVPIDSLPAQAPTRPAGATHEDWAAFQQLGLTADLLPVVSDPTIEISPQSNMKALGKTPSRVNGSGQAVGLPGWTRLRSTDEGVRRWGQDNRLGVCVQTRVVRAIDIDIAGDAAARAVVDFIQLGVGALPRRFRSNSGKCLLTFRMPGNYPKRVIKTASGNIEFLGTGNQFVAAGRHPLGVHYEWVDADGVIGVPSEIPELTPDEFEVLWQALIDRFALPDGASEGRSATVLSAPRRAADIDDPDVAHLYKICWVLEERDGKLDGECPWASEHSSVTSLATYFPAGVGGHDHAGYECLHGSCSKRTIFDFRRAVGLDKVEDAFAVLDLEGPGLPELLPAFNRTAAGKIKPTRGNIEMALTRSHLGGLQIRLDTFREEVMVAPAGTGAWRPIKDADYTDLCKRMEAGDAGFLHIPRDLIREMVNNVAEHNKFDSAQHWLAGCKWDGVERVETFLSVCLGAADTPYTRAVSRYLFTALAGRLLEPGIKADMVPVLVGRQGGGKSTVAASLAPSRDAFLELDLGKADDDQAREMRGTLVVELGELKGLRAKEQAALKAFISRREDVWIGKWKEHATRYLRRSIFIGTTNSREFLADDTGHRRWLPVEVAGHPTPEAVHAAGAAVARDREQLWAEGADLFRENGIEWQTAERLAQEEHSKFEVTEPWTAAIEGWLARDDMDGSDAAPRGDGAFATEEVLLGAVRIELRHITDAHRKRVAAVLRKLGFADRREQMGGARATRWRRVESFA